MILYRNNDFSDGQWVSEYLKSVYELTINTESSLVIVKASSKIEGEHVQTLAIYDLLTGKSVYMKKMSYIPGIISSIMNTSFTSNGKMFYF